MNCDDKLDKSGEMKKYEYSILRYIHDYSCGEYVNIGVMLRHEGSNIIQYKLNKRYGRISNFFNNFEGKKYRNKVDYLEKYLKMLLKNQRKIFSTTTTVL